MISSHCSPHRARRIAASAACAVFLSVVVFGASSAFARDVNSAAGASTSERAPFHLRLEKSEPSKDAVLATAPTAIHLWYSLPPEMAVTAVKLANADGRAIAVGVPHRASGATASVDVDIKDTLRPGSYIVSWKTASKDGHPVTGDFSFTVKVAE
jgi:methionine-rich copper-binding protein CopC